ncbi:MAG TPA: tetratricopeptide repeat protein, partial [Acidobacteriota bacterium]|nr:tetratricopeptide repeat protein [Acidobacteriota bacterium]
MNQHITPHLWLASILLLCTLAQPVWCQREYLGGGKKRTSTTRKKQPSRPKSDHTRPDLTAPPLIKQWEEYIAKGNQARNLNQFTEAELLFREAVQIAETGVKTEISIIQSLTLLGDVLFLEEKYQEAEPVFIKLLDLKQQTTSAQPAEITSLKHRIADLFVLQAQVRIKSEQLEEAIQDYTQAIKYAPQAFHYCNRADLRVTKKEYDEALDDYKHAIELDSINIQFYQAKLAKVFMARALTKNNNGDYNQALADLNQALELDPQNANLYTETQSKILVNRSTIESNNSDIDTALSTLNQALKLNPQNTLAIGRLADLYESRGILNTNEGNYERALADFEQARQIDPTKAPRLDARLARLYIHKGTIEANKTNYDAAIQDFQKAIEVDPSNTSSNQSKLSEIYYLRAVFKFNRGEYKATIHDCT